jgi:hypothetical protein
MITPLQMLLMVTFAGIASLPAFEVTQPPSDMIIYRADNVQITSISERWTDKETNQTRIRVTFTGDWKQGDPGFSMQGVFVSPKDGVVICAQDNKELVDLGALEAHIKALKTENINVMIHGGAVNDGKGTTFSPPKLIAIEKSK